MTANRPACHLLRPEWVGKNYPPTLPDKNETYASPIGRLGHSGRFCSHGCTFPPTPFIAAGVQIRTHVSQQFASHRSPRRPPLRSGRGERLQDAFHGRQWSKPSRQRLGSLLCGLCPCQIGQVWRLQSALKHQQIERWGLRPCKD